MTQAAWTFETARFRVELQLTEDFGYQYDGDDPNGDTQRKLDNGDYVAFDARVIVYCDGCEIGSDSLGGSVYEQNKVSEFWTAHRTSPARYRNTLSQKASNVCICHYFPDMVRIAVIEARKTLCNHPRMRCA